MPFGSMIERFFSSDAWITVRLMDLEEMGPSKLSIIANGFSSIQGVVIAFGILVQMLQLIYASG